MDVYLILFITYVMCVFFESICVRRIKGNKKVILGIWMLMLTLPLWFMVAFRATSVGNDTIMYEYLYNKFSVQQFSTSLSSSTMDRGFIFLSRVIGKLMLEYKAFQVVLATITYYLYARFIYRYSKNFALSWIIFITLLSFARTMNISREMLAVAISLCAFEYVKQRKLFKFLCIIAVAAIMHKSAILLIFIYPFSHIKWGPVKKAIIVATSTIIAVLFDKLIIIFVNITGKYSYLISSIYTEGGKMAQVVNVLFGIFFLFLAIYSGFLNVGKLSHENNKLHVNQKSIEEKNILLSYMGLAIVISCAGIGFGLADRAALYFTIFYMIVVPNSLLKIESRINKCFISIFIVTAMSAYFFAAMIYRNNWHSVIPYLFWWN